MVTMNKHVTPVFHIDAGLSKHEMNALEKAHREDALDLALDEALRCTFPASDPIALSFSVAFFAVGSRKRFLRKSANFIRKSS
jgi:hypothetical protein